MKTPVTYLIFAILSPLVWAEESLDNTPNKLDAFELPEVEVIGTTPLGATGLAKEKVSYNVQSLEDEDITRHEALDLTDVMRRKLGSVNINENQGNPFQPDITYRGYNVSPLIGTPIGMSVYQDGVRVNEPFGDTVNWDLIPKNAIANVDLIPGSNPLFGLNTLGGALSVRTKSGFSHGGTRAQMYGGSFGRKAFEAEHGGSKGDFDWFFSGNIFEDDGWRPFSRSAVRQAFGKVGWENENTDLDFTFTFADNKLNGVGPAATSDLALDRRAIYTAPDTIRNALYFFNLKGSHQFSDTLSLAGNAYYRANTINTFNSNTGNSDDTCENFDPNFPDRCDSGQKDANGNIIYVDPASNVANRITQDGAGVNLQLTSTEQIFAHDNQLTVGGGYNGSHTHFTQDIQDAIFSPARATIGDGPFNPDVNLKGETEYGSVFITDTYSLYPWLHLNASAGWNKANIILKDKIGTALNGNHTFDRLNPSAGFTLQPLKALDLNTPLEDLTIYGNYNEGFRAPTPVELSCANPDAPCTLPSAYTDDPPLKPVVSKTFEAGVRGKFSDALQWNVGLYHSQLSNDILFINAPQSAVSGYFKNVGETRRLGAELGLNGTWEKLNWYLNYNFVDATYQSTTLLQTGGRSVLVHPGNHLPAIPQQTVKFGAEYELLKGWFFGGDLQYVSSQYLRGDDNNSGQFGKVREYAIVNLNTRYEVTKNVEVFAMAKNVFDANYETYGIVNQNIFKGGNSEAFLGPGAPIGGWAGIRVKFE